MTAPDILLDVSHLAYSYNGLAAVRDVSFRVGSGEVVALLGANGAGKSTTVKVVAGALNAGIGALQVFAPGWPDGDWIARSGLPGRAVGNLRQPNHLSSLLLWAAIATVGLLQMRRLRPWPARGFC